MEKFKYSKFQEIFKSMKDLVHPKVYSETYSELNTFATAALYLNRVQKVSLPYEKIIYQGYLENFHGSKAMNYFGLYKNKEEELFIFSIKTDSFKSTLELIESVKENLIKGGDSVIEYEEKFFKMKYRVFNSRRAAEAKNVMFSIMNKFNSILPYRENQNKKTAIYKKQKKAYNEYLYFKHRYIAKFLTGERADDYISFIYEIRDIELLRAEKNMFSQHRSKSYKKLLEKTKEMSLDKIKDFYKKYPLLITLFLDYDEKFPPKEKEVSSNFIKEKDKNLSFIENLKEHFSLTDKNLEEIERLSWQKNIILKNRPIALIEMIKNDLILSNAANRRESLSFYVSHYYFKNNMYFQPIKNIDDFVKINVNRSDYSVLRGDIENKFTKLEKELNSLGVGSNKFATLEGKDILNTVLRSRYFKERDMFLKKEIKSNGITFNVEKTISGVYIQSKCDRYKAYLDIVMLNNKQIVLDWKLKNSKDIECSELMEEIKEDIEKTIELEFNRLGNKRYPTSQFISMPFFFSYLIQYHNRKDLEKKQYFFFAKISREFKKIKKDSFISQTYNEKEVECDLLDLI